MLIDLDIPWVVTSVVSASWVLGGIGVALYTKNLQDSYNVLKKQHEEDVERLEDKHEGLEEELKCQREAIIQSRETAINLNNSINRLNDILAKLEQTTAGKVTQEQCAFHRRVSDIAGYNRRKTDKELLPEDLRPGYNL